MNRGKGCQYAVYSPCGVCCTWLEDEESLRSICYIASDGINITILEETEREYTSIVALYHNSRSLVCSVIRVKNLTAISIRRYFESQDPTPVGTLRGFSGMLLGVEGF